MKYDGSIVDGNTCYYTAYMCDVFTRQNRMNEWFSEQERCTNDTSCSFWNVIYDILIIRIDHFIVYTLHVYVVLHSIQDGTRNWFSTQV